MQLVFILNSYIVIVVVYKYNSCSVAYEFLGGAYREFCTKLHSGISMNWLVCVLSNL